MKALKSLLKHSSRNKASNTPAAPSQQEPRLGPAQLVNERRKQRETSGSDQSERLSQPYRSAPTSHASSSRRESKQENPTNVDGDRSVDATDHAPKPSGTAKDGDSFENDYRAYTSALASRTSGSKSSVDGEFFSLGSDSRLRTGDSEMKHSEDVANRNIEQYGSDSRAGSLASTKFQAAPDHNARRRSVAASVGSAGSLPSTADSVSSPYSPSSPHSRYALGTGVPTEGGLIDGILPHVEQSNPQLSDRKKWPPRVARDESHLSQSSLRRGLSKEDGSKQSSGKTKGRDGAMDLRESLMVGPEGYDLKAAVDGVVDLKDSEDTEKQTEWAPAVTHEVVKPHQHEIIQERIYREIHNHDVFRYIQPVYQTEILPARHWVYDANNKLVEVPVDALPECTGAKQRWAIIERDREKAMSHKVRSALPSRKTKILSDKTYMTPEGFERRETTILHPPELEDLSDYAGPVVPIEFLHHAPEQEIEEQKPSEKISNGSKISMNGLSEALPVVYEGSSSSPWLPTESSGASSREVKRASILRKPVPVPSSG